MKSGRPISTAHWISGAAVRCGPLLLDFAFHDLALIAAGLGRLSAIGGAGCLARCLSLRLSLPLILSRCLGLTLTLTSLALLEGFAAARAAVMPSSRSRTK